MIAAVRPSSTSVRDINWVGQSLDPKRNIYYNNNYRIEANTKITGVNYSSSKEVLGYVGTNISFKTFATAVHNPYSV